MIVIVGLGNPGEKYHQTRHNIGFMVVEQFLKDFEPVRRTTWEVSQKLKSDTARIDWQPLHGKLEQVLLVRPATYMNNSGMAVSLAVQFYKIQLEDLWVVYDDVDLPLGAMKIRFGGASAGHHGIDSIMQSLGTDKFWRFRMGIGTEKRMISAKRVKNIDDFVLGTFAHGEVGKAKVMVKKGADALAQALEEGLETAMNRYNAK